MSQKKSTVEDIVRFHLERQQWDHTAALAAPPRSGPATKYVFHQIDGFVEIPDAELLERTISLLASAEKNTILWIHHDGRRYRFLYGHASESSTEAIRQSNKSLSKMLHAYYPGARIDNVNRIHLDQYLRDLEQRESCSAIMGLPSERKATEVQTRLDEALDGLCGLPFDLIITARPMSQSDVQQWGKSLVQLANLTATLANTTATKQVEQQFQASVRNTSRAVYSEGLTFSDIETDLEESYEENYTSEAEKKKQETSKAGKEGGRP